MMRQILTFYIQDKLLALPLDKVSEILRTVYITPFPEQSPELPGVINLRGNIVPVFDLGHLLTAQPTEIHFESRLICTNALQFKSALLVDAIDDVQDIESVCHNESLETLDLGATGLETVLLNQQTIIPVLDINQVVKRKSAICLDTMFNQLAEIKANQS